MVLKYVFLLHEKNIVIVNSCIFLYYGTDWKRLVGFDRDDLVLVLEMIGTVGLCLDLFVGIVHNISVSDKNRL